MNRGDAKTPSALGFLTVVEHETHGLFGGYLVLNFAGRPIEFHCTTPVKANRAQEILYGPTLAPFLYGEQIGQALLNKAETPALAVLTDVEAALAMREFTQAPVALVMPGDDGAPAADLTIATGVTHRIDARHDSLAGEKFVLGRNRLAAPIAFRDDREAVCSRLAGLAESFDLLEPFARIRDAIEEAQRGGRS